METLRKELRNIHIYYAVISNVLKLVALKKYEVPTAGLPMLLSELSSSTTAVSRLQHPTVPDRLTTIPDDEGNVQEKWQCWKISRLTRVFTIGIATVMVRQQF